MQEGYLNLMLPIIKDTLCTATIRKPKSQKSGLDKQAEQRKKILERMKTMQEQGVIFKVPPTEPESIPDSHTSPETGVNNSILPKASSLHEQSR